MSRWTAAPGSQELEYIAWKEKMREWYTTFDYNSITGVPFHEPLRVTGSFYVTQNWSGKDLDNLIKGVIDTLNPTRSKNFSGLATFAWVDDKQIVFHGPWAKIHSVEPRIIVKVQSLWTRSDHNTNWFDADDTHPFNWRLIGADYADTYWVWPQAEKDVFLCYDNLAYLLWHRFCHVYSGISPQAFIELVSRSKHDEVFEAITTGKYKGGAKVQRVVSVLHEHLPDPVRWHSETEFRSSLFEETARALSEQYQTAWSAVRSRLMHQFINWASRDSDPNFKAFVDQLEMEHAKRKK
jgi:hypothetical protein